MLKVYYRDDSGHATNDPCGVAVTGEVFSQVDVSGPYLVDRAVSQTNLRLAGKGDEILPSGSHVPVTEKSYFFASSF